MDSGWQAHAPPYAARAAACFVVCELVYHVALAVAPKSFAAGDRRTFALKVVNILHAALVGPLAARALVGRYLFGWDGDAALAAAVAAAVNLDGAAAPALFSGGFGADAARLLTSITVGFFAWDLYRLDAWAKSSPGERRLMVVHHVVSVAVWPVAALTGVAGPFLLHFLATELSSPLLQGRWYAQAFRGRGSPADAAASALFAAAFVAVRTSNVHVVAHCFARARPFDGALHGAVPAWIRLLGTATLGLPSVLNAVWTAQIALLGKKMLLGKKKAKV